MGPFFLCLFTVAVYAGDLERKGKKGDLECFGKLGKDAGTLWKDLRLCKDGKKSLKAEGTCEGGVTCTRGESSLTVCKEGYECHKSKAERVAARKAKKEAKKKAKKEAIIAKQPKRKLKRQPRVIRK